MYKKKIKKCSRSNSRAAAMESRTKVTLALGQKGATKSGSGGSAGINLGKCPFCAQPLVWLHFLLVHCRSLVVVDFFFFQSSNCGLLSAGDFLSLFVCFWSFPNIRQLKESVFFGLFFFPGLLDLFNHLKPSGIQARVFFFSPISRHVCLRRFQLTCFPAWHPIHTTAHLKRVHVLDVLREMISFLQPEANLHFFLIGLLILNFELLAPSTNTRPKCLDVGQPVSSCTRSRRPNGGFVFLRYEPVSP